MALLYSIIPPLTIAILFYGFSPTFKDFEPQAFRVTIFDRLSGALKENNRLSTGERLFEGRLLGPESLAVHEGCIYTGTTDGCITKITGNQMTCFTKIKDCEKSSCSRPLGMRFDNAGTLYVADGILGVFSVDIKTGSATPLIVTDEIVGGKPVTFPDDLSISNDGVIYFSDGSVRWNLENVGLSVLEHENSGRIIQYDTRTNKSSVLVDGLYFPNGVQLSKSEESLMIAEFSNHRVLRHHLKGERKGQTEVFADVPGFPDNIRTSKNGYWVALLSYNNPINAGVMEKLNEYPFARKVIVRFQQSIASLLLYINRYWNSQNLEAFANQLESGFDWIIPPVMYGMAVEIDENGKFTQSVQSPDGKNGALSEILEYDGHLYGASFLNHYLIRMKSNNES